MVYLNLFHWFKQTPIYLTPEDIPVQLATRQWLIKRGYHPIYSPKGFLQTKTKKIPLYEKERAKKIIEGADLTFTGKYFKENQAIPPYYKTKDYLPYPPLRFRKESLSSPYFFRISAAYDEAFPLALTIR